MTNNLQEQAGTEMERDNIQASNDMQDQDIQSAKVDVIDDDVHVTTDDNISETNVASTDAAVSDVHIKNKIPDTGVSAELSEIVPAEDASVENSGDDAVPESIDDSLDEGESDSAGSISDDKLNAEEETDHLSEKVDAEASNEKIDFSEYGREAMVERLRMLVDKGAVDTIRDEVDAIKFYFYKKLKAETDQKRSEYIEKGGTEDNYVYEEDAQELILKNLLNKYRELRDIQNEQLEAEKQKNLEEKLKIIEELKELTNRTESIGETFQIFRELQNRWRTIGLVPQGEVKNLWDTYHHYVEIFYDYIKINKELRDLDFKRNLEAKMDLCEKAEKLLLAASVVNAFHTLQTYHEQWREIGPVPQEMRVEIWERFKAVSAQINKKHQEYFETLKETHKKNLEAKLALCEKVDEIAKRPMTSSSQWEKNSKEIIEIQKLWNTIGFASKRENAKLYKRFHTICDKFFNQKREYYGREKIEQENNLQLKEDLCVQAEALKDSAEWKSTTEDFIELQKKWKEIGSVPARYREPIWKRFRSACDYFFEQKAKHFSSVDSEYDNNLKAKRELIEKIKKYTHSNDAEESFEQLKEFQREWSDIGFVPIKYKKKIQEEYREVINKQFDALRLNDSERDRLRYKSKIENLVSTPHSRGKLDSERDKLMRKYQQLQSDLVVWENNIGFFSKSKNSEAMIANVQRMIEQGRAEMKELEEKIRIIDLVEDDDK